MKRAGDDRPWQAREASGSASPRAEASATDSDSIVQRCEELLADLAFGSVADWKRKSGGKAIGFMPIYVPRELIHASGMLPVGIMGAGDYSEIIRGDAYFQSYICRIPRSTIELAVSGKLDLLDGMLFPAICDVIRNLSGMWQLLFPGKYAKFLDLPQDFGPAGREFHRGEMEALGRDLARISGIEPTPARLKESIRLYNENREAIRRLYELRERSPHRVPSSELYLLMRASNVLEVTEHTRMLGDYLRSATLRERPARDHVRVILSGVFCEQPPLGLIRALEASGCYIVDDDWVLGARYQLGPVEDSGDPLGDLVESYLSGTVSSASRYETSDRKGSQLIAAARARRADGVLFAGASFCDPALLERPMLEAALDRAGIPHMGFKYAENTGQVQVIKEEAGTFADSIKLWGAG